MSGFSDYVLSHLANRVDAFGAYREGRAFVVKEPLTARILEAHERGERTVGIFAAGPDGSSRFGVFDIDAPDDIEDVDERELMEQENFGACLMVCERLVGMGYAPLIEDSDGAGSFHVWVTFAAPSRTAEVCRFLKAVAHDVGIEAETFPKAPDIGQGYGGWIRLPGRHPRRGHWSRVWSFAERRWNSYEGSIAVFCDHEESRPPTEADAPRLGEEIPAGRVEGTSDPAAADVIPEGGRNAALMSLAGTMRRRGMLEDEIATALLVVNRNRCRPPLEEEEVRKIARSITRYPPSDPVAVAVAVPGTREEAIEALNARLVRGVEVASIRRVIRRGKLDGSVDLELSSGAVFCVGTFASLLSFDSFRRRFAEGTAIVLPKVLRKEWDDVAQLLMSSAEECEGESVPEAIDGLLRGTLARRGAIDVDDEEGVEELVGSPSAVFFRRGGHLHLSLDGLSMLVRNRSDVRVDRRELGDVLARAGWEKARLSFGARGAQIRYAAYRAPSGWPE